MDYKKFDDQSLIKLVARYQETSETGEIDAEVHQFTVPLVSVVPSLTPFLGIATALFAFGALIGRRRNATSGRKQDSF